MIVDKLGVEKIKTIGDSYMIVGGVPIENDNHAELISNNPSTANIKAIVNGVGISNAESVASYSFAHPEGYVEIVESDDFGIGGLVIEKTQLIYIIVPGAIAGTFLFLKRTNRLEGITERLPLDGLIEKFDGIKEKISEMRERE